MAESTQYEQAISPQTLAAINAHLRQVRASGRPVTDADIRAAYEAALNVEAGRSLQNRAQAIQQEQWNKQYKLQKQQLQDQRESARMSGIATIGGALWQMGGKEAITGGLKDMFAKKPIVGMGGAQTQIAPGSATVYQGTTPVPATVSTPTGIPSVAGDATPSSLVSPPAIGGGAQGGAMEFAKDFVLPGAVGAGVGYGVKSLTGSTGWGMAAGAGVGAIGGYMMEGDVVGGLVGGLLGGGLGGLF